MTSGSIPNVRGELWCSVTAAWHLAINHVHITKMYMRYITKITVFSRLSIGLVYKYIRFPRVLGLARYLSRNVWSWQEQKFDSGSSPGKGGFTGDVGQGKQGQSMENARQTPQGRRRAGGDEVLSWTPAGQLDWEEANLD